MTLGNVYHVKKAHAYWCEECRRKRFCSNNLRKRPLKESNLKPTN